MSTSRRPHRQLLQNIAHDVMLERGLEPEFSDEALAQARKFPGPARETGPGIRDLRSLAWCSIDNDDSRDLDQLSVSQSADGGTRLLVAIADVDALVEKDSPLDRHARKNTTSVYTTARIHPMLPERLSTDLTSLNEHEDRLAVVVSMVVAGDGSIVESEIFRALVRNQAKLTYGAVGAWLEDRGELPPAAARVPGLDALLRAQDEAAQALRRRRQEHGALDLETIEARPVFSGDDVVDLRAERPNRAKQLIEEFMIAANGVSAAFLESHGVASLRRIVRSPERWERIVSVADELGEQLPHSPDSAALEAFLRHRRKADPLRFPDLSLTIVKLMGRGEYAVAQPGRKPEGHFGLAVGAYTHSTAPNRRYPDLIEQRLLKAVLEGRKTPYSLAELEELAEHCTVQEGASARVERHVRKSAAALMLGSRVGDRFDGVVTGSSDKGTYVRVFSPPVEGRVFNGSRGLRVGQRVNVRLVGTDVEAGHVDFERS